MFLKFFFNHNILFLSILFSLTLFPWRIEAQESLNQFGWSPYSAWSYDEHVYQQFTGNSRFSGANAPSTVCDPLVEEDWGSYLPCNLSYERMWDIDFFGLGVPASNSIGLEWMRFASTTKSTLQEEPDVEPDTSGLPDIHMQMEHYNISYKLYFLNKVAESGPNIFAGAGYGVIQGYFETTEAGEMTYSSFFGIASFLQLGGELYLDPFFVRAETRPIFARNIKVSNDPYEQKGDRDALYLNFSALLFSIQVGLRF